MKNSRIIGLIGVLLAGSLAGNAYLWSQYDGKNKKLNKTVIAYEQAKLQKDSMYQILEEKEQMLDAFRTEKVSSEDMIVKQLASIRSLRRKIGFLRRKINMAAPQDVSKYTDEIMALKGQVEQFDSTNKALTNKNTTLAGNLTQTEYAMNEFKNSNTKLNARIANNAIPIFGPLKVEATYVKRGKKRITDRRKRVQNLEISFQIMENRLLNSAESFDYKFRILDPRGVVLSNNSTLKNADELYTIEESVIYDGTPQRIKLRFKNKEDYIKGKYTIVLMHEGYAKQEYIIELR